MLTLERAVSIRTCGLDQSVRIAGWGGEGANVSKLLGLHGNMVYGPSFKDEWVGVKVGGGPEGHSTSVHVTSTRVPPQCRGVWGGREVQDLSLGPYISKEGSVDKLEELRIALPPA